MTVIGEFRDRQQAALYVARESWPNEPYEYQVGWAPRLLDEPEMAQQEVTSALKRIDERRQWVLVAAKMLGVSVKEHDADDEIKALAERVDDAMRRHAESHVASNSPHHFYCGPECVSQHLQHVLTRELAGWTPPDTESNT